MTLIQVGTRIGGRSLRWRDTGDDGTLDETLYYCNDANMNVTALVDTSGTVQERYVYDPYGAVTIYDDDWSDTRDACSYDNSILYCGYYRDNETGLYHACPACPFPQTFEARESSRRVRHRYYHMTLGRWFCCNGRAKNLCALFPDKSHTARFVTPFLART